MMNDMGDDRSARSRDIVWRNSFLLVLLISAGITLTGLAAGLLDFFREPPVLSVLGRVGGIVGGAAAIGAGVLAVKADKIRSWPTLLIALANLAAAGLVILGSRVL